MSLAKRLKRSKQPIEIINTEEYNYILEWVRRNRNYNDVLSLFEFFFREDEDTNSSEEPLKTAWESLTTLEQIYLTYELGKLYKNRSLSGI